MEEVKDCDCFGPDFRSLVDAISINVGEFAEVFANGDVAEAA